MILISSETFVGTIDRIPPKLIIEFPLCRYKVPRLILVNKEPFPTTSTGKIKKNLVRRMALERLAKNRSRMEAGDIKSWTGAEPLEQSPSTRSRL